jgi:hypothetical protein
MFVTPALTMGIRHSTPRSAILWTSCAGQALEPTERTGKRSSKTSLSSGSIRLPSSSPDSAGHAPG